MENKTLINSEEGRRKVKRVMIPDDVVREIQQWLPPKSLVRFQCASKKWRSMILDEISKRNSKEEKVLLISKSSIRLIDFSKPASEMKAVTLIEFPGEESSYVGCVNGLVLYLDSQNRALILFNPWTLTRQPINIPHSNPLTRNSYAYGFGHDKSNDNYIIVIIHCDKGDGFVWSSKARNWVPLFSRRLWRRSQLVGLCVNECIYWDTGDGILCFDVKTCEFKVIEKPPGPRRSFYLSIWGDRLAAVEFIVFTTSSPRTRVWELDEQMQWIRMAIPRFILSPEDAVDYQSFCKKRKIKTNAIFHLIMAPVLRLKNGDSILLSYMLCIDSNGTKGAGVAESENRFTLLGKEDAQSKFYLHDKERNTLTTLKTPGTGNITYRDNKMIPYQNNQFSPS